MFQNISCRITGIHLQTIDHFLQSAELRAFRMARMATRCDDDAMDLVQEAMIKLVKNYSDRQPDEWRPLFFRILETRILDWHRKEAVKKKIFFWQTNTPNEDHEEDTLDRHSRDAHADPADELETDQLGKHLLSVVESLPVKQQQCYLLRTWEGLSIKETADIMGIHVNSVKSHYFRAMEKLKVAQAEYQR